MTNDDAFAGIKLSEQAGKAGVDQRLFSVTAPAQQPIDPIPGNWEVGKEGIREVSQEPAKESGKERGKGLDLDATPTRKDSFLFTEDEFEALEDLKTDFRRRHDTRVTKNDLARCALHLLVEDYDRHQERSFLGRKLLGKPGRR